MYRAKSRCLPVKVQYDITFKIRSERVEIREPLLVLHWILWGAAKLCDLRNCRTSPELVKAHEERRVRYARIGNPENIQKLLDSL